MPYQTSASTQQSTQSYQQILQSAPSFVMSAPGLMILLCSLGLAYTSMTGQKNKKKILARASLGGNKERAAARKLACQQMEERKHNKISLYIGTPRGSGIKVINGKKTLYLPEDPQTTYLPNVQGGVALFGAPDTGKSFYGVDALARSAIDQGLPTIYYDYKGHEDPPPSGPLAAYAEERGYKIWVFSPGSPDTCVCNILDYIRDPTDAEAAREIAAVLNRNLKLTDNGSSNSSYFSESGDQLAQAVLMLAKSLPAQADVMLCQKILSMDRLIERLRVAPMNLWTRAAFDQFFSTAGTPETAASIASTASLLFNRFMVPSALAAFCGQSTLPRKLTGKQLVIFRMNPKNKATVGPLMSAVMTMMINENAFCQRIDPLIVLLDEASSLYFTYLYEWINQLRSSGVSIILATQSLGVLEKTYGKNEVHGIIGGCVTQLIFQLLDAYTAETLTKPCGNEEVEYKQKSRGRGKGGSNNSTADHRQTRPLVEIQQLTKLLTGKVLLLNRGYSNGKEVRIPIFQQLKIPQQDIDAVNRSRLHWSNVRAKLIRRSTAKAPEEQVLAEREKEASLLLQLPEERQQVAELQHALATTY